MVNQVPFQSITLNNIYIYLRNKCIDEVDGDNREELKEKIIEWINYGLGVDDININFYINNFPIKNNINEIEQELDARDDMEVEFYENTDQEYVEVIVSSILWIMKYDFNVVDKIVDDIMEARCEAA